MRGNTEDLGDLVVAQAFCAKRQNLRLALRERSAVAGGCRRPKSIDQRTGDGGADRRSARFDDRDQTIGIIGEIGFEDVPAGAGFESPDHAFLLGEYGDHQNLAGGVGFAEFGNQRQTITVRQAKIEENGIDAMGFEDLTSRADAVRGEHLPVDRTRGCAQQTFAQQPIVFDHQQMTPCSVLRERIGHARMIAGVGVRDI